MFDKGKEINIDSSKGGNGDIWMRLVSLYSVAALLPEIKISIKVPIIFNSIANYTFGDRLIIRVDNFEKKIFLSYSNLGIKDLIIPLIKGKRFISPYQKSVIYDKKKVELKDYVNLIIFDVLNKFELVYVPHRKFIKFYQGYLDIISIKQFDKIPYNEFLVQMEIDYEIIKNKLNGQIPITTSIITPINFSESIIVFPSGTSRQFIPSWWAIQNLPDAFYAFYYKDQDAKEFEKLGLRVIHFYEEPGDIIFLSKKAKWTITTDSFSSHLLQSSSIRTTILLTEVLKSRIISPIFKGEVVDSIAKCHPCLHKARKVQPLCDAGYEECLNWKDSNYTNNILKTI